jgi:hypothetical protein
VALTAALPARRRDSAPRRQAGQHQHVGRRFRHGADVDVVERELALVKGGEIEGIAAHAVSLKMQALKVRPVKTWLKLLSREALRK